MIKNVQLLLLLLIVGWSGPAVLAQNSDDAREITSTYYIKNANVVQKPGRLLTNQSILIKDGLIKEMGSSVSIPFDAKVIAADSMYVYASFIDAATHTGYPKAEDERPDVKDPGNPTLKQAGITPQTVATDHIDFSDKGIKQMRELGYGYLHVLPRGRMMPGMGSVITTGELGKDYSILKEKQSAFHQLRSARGVFPNTIIGVMSKYRDLYKNASYLKKYETSYKTNPLGLSRPSQSAELKAIADYSSMPVYFKANSARDIFKVFDLNKDIKANLVLTDVKQGNLILDKIKSKNVKTVLSLELPKKIEDKKKKDEKKEEKKEEDSTKEKEKKDPLKEAFDARKMKSYAQHESQAADFAKAGLTFSFGSLSAKPNDIKGNLKRMIERGLSEDAALAALTTNAASLLGLSTVAGTVEKGKMGNIFITDKPYFEEKSKIKYYIVDGKFYENKEKPKKKKADSTGAMPDIAGTWSYNLEIPGQESTGTMIVTKSGDSYEIKVDSSEEPGDYEDAFDIEADGNTMTFSLTVDNGGFTMNIDTDLTFEDDSFEGTMTITEFGSFPISGSKQSPK